MNAATLLSMKSACATTTKPKKKNQDAVRMAKLRAKKLSKKRRQEIARMGAIAKNKLHRAKAAAILEESKDSPLTPLAEAR